MTQIDPNEAMIDLARAVLLQAIEDYVTLRELGCVRGHVIETKMWNYTINTNWRFKPIGYSAPHMVRELIDFLAGPDLDVLCSFLGQPACRLRKRVGIVEGSEPLLTTADMPWISTPSITRRGPWTKRKKMKSGENLASPRLYSKRPTHINKNERSNP
jgi:hypothetical protein